MFDLWADLGDQLLMSVKLFHGPGAWQAACQEAESLGRLVADPFGADGLKVDEARQIVMLLNSTPVCSELGVVLVGPMDDANSKASDALLKSLEENDGEVVVPVLWARDLGTVTATVRSRCLPVWVPGTDSVLDEVVENRARALVDAYMGDDQVRIVSELDEPKGMAPLVVAVAEALVPHLADKGARMLWERLRPLTKYDNPTPYEVLSAFVG